MRRGFPATIIAAMVLVTAVSAAQRPQCPVCGMYADSDPKFQSEIEFKDGGKVSFESPRHAFEYYFNLAKYSKGSRKETDVKAFWVRDYATGEKVNAREYHFLVGSRLQGPMGPEIVPLAHNQIPKFQKRYGGEHRHFSDLNRDTIRDLDQEGSGSMSHQHSH